MVGSQIGKAVPDSLNRTYSAGQIATLSKLSHGTVEELVRFGLLNPRGGLFGFRDLADNSAASRTEPPFVRFEAIRNRIVPLILQADDEHVALLKKGVAALGTHGVTRIPTSVRTSPGRTSARLTSARRTSAERISAGRSS